VSAITYVKAGVSIDKGNAFVRFIKPLAKKTRNAGVCDGIGGFSSLYDVAPFHLKRPLLVASTDGVGTKLAVAKIAGRHDTIGIDLVAMCVNDLVTCGARPIFFLDYLATGKLDLAQSKAVMRGIVKGCQQAGCALVGGETAEMPGFYQGPEYDLAGFAVGVVEKSKVIDHRLVRAGDAILGLHSSGFHSNGYSLLRKVFSADEMRGKIGRVLLTPTQIYVKPVLALIEKVEVRAIAHITGGGFYDNIPRVIPKGLGAHVARSTWRVPEIFWQVMKRSGVSFHEMFRTFNMGIGMTVVIRPEDIVKAQTLLKRFGIQSNVIGEVIKGKGVRLT